MTQSKSNLILTSRLCFCFFFLFFYLLCSNTVTFLELFLEGLLVLHPLIKIFFILDSVISFIDDVTFGIPFKILLNVFPSLCILFISQILSSVSILPIIFTEHLIETILSLTILLFCTIFGKSSQASKSLLFIINEFLVILSDILIESIGIDLTILISRESIPGFILDITVSILRKQFFHSSLSFHRIDTLHSRLNIIQSIFLILILSSIIGFSTLSHRRFKCSDSSTNSTLLSDSGFRTILQIS